MVIDSAGMLAKSRVTPLLVATGMNGPHSVLADVTGARGHEYLHRDYLYSRLSFSSKITI
jgi:hypothetical protein